MDILTLADNFRKLDTDKIIDESLKETEEVFEELNRSQLKAGKTSKGETIAPKYKNPKYARVKNQINPLPGLGVPDLYLTGSFQRQLDAEASKEVIDIISRDEKGPELEQKYPDILGLGGVYQEKYVEENLSPKIHGKISNLVGLNFE